MNYSRFVIAAAGFIVCMPSLVSQAETVVSCQEMVKACFVSATEQRDSCIQTAAASSACESSEIGALVKKRAQFTGLQQSSEDQGPAFLGPQIINRRCVNNFDTAWSAALVQGPLTNDSISRFSQALDTCATSEKTTLPRP